MPYFICKTAVRNGFHVIAFLAYLFSKVYFLKLFQKSRVQKPKVTLSPLLASA